MPQDQEAKERYEHEAHERKEAREEAAEVRVESAYFLNDNEQIHADHTTGRKTGAPTPEDRELIDGDRIKHVYELLPQWHKDDLRRLKIVHPGTQLEIGDTYIDLHNLNRGEFRARGGEIVHEANQLIVSKKDTDFEVWDRLIRRDI